MRQFAVHNVRLGLATNSSSSHSLVYLPPGSQTDVGYEGQEFGWDNFTLQSEGGKLGYLAQLLKSSISNLSPEFQKAIVEAWVGPLDLDGYIDHESTMSFPLNWGGSGVHPEFFREFKEFLLRPDVTILGGNDNDDEGHPLASGSFKTNLPRDIGSATHAGYVARKDDKFGYWTLFHRVTGAKLRISLEDPSKAVTPTKASSPELIDLKITDFCPYGCSYCYQGSTPKGEHADRNLLRDIAYACGELQVFEVALGGGEPTLHPDFTDILYAFRSHGVVPNFTTRNMSWMRDPVKRHQILESAGAFAFSVDSADQVLKLHAVMSEHGIPTDRVNIQYVVGASWGGLKSLFEITKALRLPLVLLGWKNTGRGSNEKPKESSAEAFKTFLENHKSYQLPRLSIDTVLAAQWEKGLQKVKYPPTLYNPTEGAFSMYLDAVAKKAGPSSYCHPSKMVDFSMTQKYMGHKRIQGTFEGIHPERGDL